MAGYAGRFPREHGRGQYDAAAVVPFLRVAVRFASESPQAGLRLVSRRYAERYGVDHSSAERHIGRIINGHTLTIREQTADRLATFLGMHPSNIWGTKGASDDGT